MEDFIFLSGDIFDDFPMSKPEKPEKLEEAPKIAEDIFPQAPWVNRDYSIYPNDMLRFLPGSVCII